MGNTVVAVITYLKEPFDTKEVRPTSEHGQVHHGEVLE